MEERNRNAKYFYISFASYGISFLILLVSIYGVGSFLAFDSTRRLANIVFIYVIPFQLLGLLLTGIGLSKSLTFDNNKNKKLGRIGLIYGFGFFVMFLCMWVFLIWIMIQD
jgi:hypothetical protein